MKKFQFAVILTKEGKTVLVVENLRLYKSLSDWERRFRKNESTVLFCSETDSIDFELSHYFIS